MGPGSIMARMSAACMGVKAGSLASVAIIPSILTAESESVTLWKMYRIFYVAPRCCLEEAQWSGVVPVFWMG